MAFCQSTHSPQQRQLTLPVAAPSSSAQIHERTRRQSEGSQEWILFSPSLADSAAGTNTTLTDLTPRTAGLSRLSDVGSLGTVAQSQVHNYNDDEELGVDEVEEGEELDSLDSHLHAFREPSIYRTTSQQLDQNGEAMLPTHDGLGTFGESSTPLQEHLWRFEQYNPRGPLTRHRRLSSVQRRLDEVDRGEAEESERIQRVEQWRMEQSQILVDEIEKESRQRRMSRASRKNKVIHDPNEKLDVKRRLDGNGEEGLLSSRAKNRATAQVDIVEETESFWRRITRRVIRDLIGIDEPLLSVICGESLPSGATAPSLQTMGEQGSDSNPICNHSTTLHSYSSWEDRLFDRIARELGTLVHQLSEHPGAFSTFLRAQQVADYAGITPASTEPKTTALPSVAHHITNPATSTNPFFPPTIQQSDASTHAALWGIEEEQAGFLDDEEILADQMEAERLKREREYWEKDLDIKMVFGFLRNRFVSTSRTSTQRSMSTPSAYDPAARAALIRHHHPLVSRSHEQKLHLQRRRGNMLHHHHPSSSLNSVKRPGSSCASQSTKKSAKRGSGSSRNYWDLGGSIGSGSAIHASTGFGVWGEV
ncbi:MAG: hypothetical protein M1812_000192 [Candelaria pacifica]|nr:MAG: hypothetical protein M1812_000192 [Candelaria pacifica]